MLNWMNLIYLIVCVFLLNIEYAHLPVTSNAYSYIWVAVSLSYPLCSFLRGRHRFWMGLLALLSIFAAAHVSEAVVILYRENGVQGFLHPDYETLVLFSFQFIGPIATAAIWYPIGYLGAWFSERHGRQTRR